MYSQTQQCLKKAVFALEQNKIKYKAQRKKFFQGRNRHKSKYLTRIYLPASLESSCLSKKNSNTYIYNVKKGNHLYLLSITSETK